MHEHGKPGARIEAMAPRGKFVLDQSSERPVALLSGGVGLTPMIAITEHIVAEGRRTGTFRPVYFIHGTQNSRVHAFATHVRALAAEHPAMRVHFAYSRPAPTDEIGVTHDSQGQITIDLVKTVLPFGDYDFYLCGPSEFMNSLCTRLTGMSVRPERIHYESFGPGTVLKPQIAATPAAGAVAGGIARVRFARSGVDAVWSREKGSLLELAERAGLAPAFGCRSGICSTCRTTITGGAVDYLEEPLASRAADEVLLCCSTPRQAPGHQPEGYEPDVVLDL
jgi:ferredoxin-NADP reductase